MNLEIAKQWTAALRSGEYKQTTECLHNANGHCCLGVLTELFMKQPDSGMIRDDGGYESIYRWGEGAVETAALPRPVLDWAEISSRIGELGDTELTAPLQSLVADDVNDRDIDDCDPESLTCLNDEGMTFAQIADVIDFVAADL